MNTHKRYHVRSHNSGHPYHIHYSRIPTPLLATSRTALSIRSIGRRDPRAGSDYTSNQGERRAATHGLTLVTPAWSNDRAPGHNGRDGGGRKGDRGAGDATLGPRQGGALYGESRRQRCGARHHAAWGYALTRTDRHVWMPTETGSAEGFYGCCTATTPPTGLWTWRSPAAASGSPRRASYLKCYPLPGAIGRRDWLARCLTHLPKIAARGVASIGGRTPTSLVPPCHRYRILPVRFLPFSRWFSPISDGGVSVSSPSVITFPWIVWVDSCGG